MASIPEKYIILRAYKRISNYELAEYIDNSILLKYYDIDDECHGIAHIRDVVETVDHMLLTETIDTKGLDLNMLYTAAYCHDIGRIFDDLFADDTNRHELISARMFKCNTIWEQWFTNDQISIIARAIEDHRASSSIEPKSIYGKILADSDRCFDYETALRRCIYYNVNKYRDLELVKNKVCNHMRRKFGTGGYTKLWIPNSFQEKRLIAIREIVDSNKLEDDIYEKLNMKK